MCFRDNAERERPPRIDDVHISRMTGCITTILVNRYAAADLSAQKHIIVVGTPEAALRTHHPRFVALECGQVDVSNRGDADLTVEVSSDRRTELVSHEGLRGLLPPIGETIPRMN